MRKSFIFFILVSFFLLSTLMTSKSYAQDVCDVVEKCTYSQIPDGSSFAKCYRGVCKSPGNCAGLNNNCEYMDLPKECGIGTEERCPGITLTPSPIPGPLTPSVAPSSCGLDGQYCCAGSAAEPLCKDNNLSERTQDGRCKCTKVANAVAPPAGLPCAPGYFREESIQTTGGTPAVVKKCLAVETGIGIIEVEPTEFIKRLFAILLSLAGGIALALIIYSGYKLMTSQGNPETIQGARETIVSAIVGLLFILFSFVIFQVITTDILQIPFIK